MKLNNKGFAISSVLYTLLICFLMFMLVTLAMFSSSTTLLSAANNDYVDGTDFRAEQVNASLGEGKKWYETNSIVKINSKYGVYYWPRDFYEYDPSSDTFNGTIGEKKNSVLTNKKLSVQCGFGEWKENTNDYATYDYVDCNNGSYNLSLYDGETNFIVLKITDMNLTSGNIDDDKVIYTIIDKIEK